MPRWPATRTVRARARQRRARRAGRSGSSGSLGEIREIQIDREDDDASQAQASTNPSTPKLNAVDRPVGPDGVASRKVVGRAPGGARERRGRKRIALAERFQRAEGLAPLLLFALTRISHGRSIGR